MDKPSAPPAPNYQALAAQQGQNNIDLAKMQNPNVIGPYGTQTVTYGGTPDKTVDNFDADAYLKAHPDVAAAIQAGNNQVKLNGNRGNNVSSAWEHYDLYGRNAGYDFTTRPTAVGNIPTITQTLSPEQQALMGKQNQVRGLLGDLGIQGANAMKGIVGTSVDYSGAPQVTATPDLRNKVIDAYMGRVNEDLGNKRETTNSNLIAAGIRPGSKAYDDQMNLINRQETDARNQAFLSSGQEMTREQQLGMQARNQWLSEYQNKRQTPLNEIAALLSGSQVTNPFQTPSYSPMNPQGTPLMQAGQLGSDYMTDVYNMHAAQAGQINSGLFGLGAAGIAAFSDRRLKRNIQRVGTHPLGIGIYDYDIFDRRERGVMADEVETVMPEAVLTHDSGYKMVDYGRLTWQAA